MDYNKKEFTSYCVNSSSCNSLQYYVASQTSSATDITSPSSELMHTRTLLSSAAVLTTNLKCFAEAETDKTPSSPTRRKLPKTPV